MKILISSIITLFIILPTEAQAFQSNYNSDTEVARIGNQPVYLSEVLDNYRINQTHEEIETTELIEFLPSYIEYRLKLKKGLDDGLDQNPEILAEMEEFGRQAARIYWLENEIKYQIISEYKERSNSELKAYHILIEVPENASHEETEAIYMQLLEARQLLIDGADPAEVNRTYSTERNGNYMGGSLPWITAGRTVKPFEDALYSLETGEISGPVRTQFGYHVIYLQAKRERSPDRRVSHIYFQDTEEQSAAELAAEAYQALMNGTQWNDAVERYSLDRSGVHRGGSIGWVGYAMQFPEPFIDAVMSEDPDAAFSEPVEMAYGYHIIRIDSVRTYPDEEQQMEDIISDLERLQRLSPNEDDIIEALKSEGHFTVNEDAKEAILSAGETGLSTFDINKTLVVFNEKVHTLGDYVAFSRKTESDAATAIKEFFNGVVLSEIIDLTSAKFPAFKSQITNFLDGLIVFRVNEDYIWNMQAADRDSLKAHFELNKENYRLDTQYTYYTVSSFSDSLIHKAKSLVESGLKPEKLSEQMDAISVRQHTTVNRGAADYAILEKLEPMEVSEIQVSGVRHTFYYIENIEQPRQMTFEEAFSRVVHDYQPIHEAYFIEQLKKEFKVELFSENIRL